MFLSSFLPILPCGLPLAFFHSKRKKKNPLAEVNTYIVVLCTEIFCSVGVMLVNIL